MWQGHDHPDAVLTDTVLSYQGPTVGDPVPIKLGGGRAGGVDTFPSAPVIPEQNRQSFRGRETVKKTHLPCLEVLDYRQVQDHPTPG